MTECRFRYAGRKQLPNRMLHPPLAVSSRPPIEQSTKTKPSAPTDRRHPGPVQPARHGRLRHVRGGDGARLEAGGRRERSHGRQAGPRDGGGVVQEMGAVRGQDKGENRKNPCFFTADNRRMLEVSMMFKTPSGTDPAGQVGRGELNSSLRSTARYQQIVPQRRPEAGVLAETRRHVRTARQG